MRRSIHVPGFAHANPIPAASRIGPFVFSGAITGRDPVTGTLPPDLETQVTNVFQHIRAIVTAAGATTDDIAKLTVWLSDYRDRDALNRSWTAMFPDPDTRPARQTMSATFDGGIRIQCDLVAVILRPDSSAPH